MAEPDTGARFWKRTSLMLAIAVVTICALISVVTWGSAAHQRELNAVRAQSEKDRETLTKMWQATDDELKRERRKAAGGR